VVSLRLVTRRRSLPIPPISCASRAPFLEGGGGGRGSGHVASKVNPRG